ncbi:hypothetical protein [Pedobacter rhizosphaerae]|nr:hypothetical protein [Pedobacter rhizosphaerae]
MISKHYHMIGDGYTTIVFPLAFYSKAVAGSLAPDLVRQSEGFWTENLLANIILAFVLIFCLFYLFKRFKRKEEN